LGTCIYIVAQLHALRAQQNKYLLSVDFSSGEHWWWLAYVMLNS